MTEPERLPPTNEESEEELARMSLFEHLEELRSRILRSVVVLVLGFFVCFGFAKQIYRVLALPIEPYVDKLAFSRVQDPFMIYVKVALLAAVFLTSPFIMWQVWRFVSPGLYKRERRMAIPFVVLSSGFFIGGGMFGYFIAFPFAVEFLLGMGEQFEPVIMIGEYLSIQTMILLGLGVMFQLPIVIFLLAQIGVVTPGFLIRHFRWAVVIIFIVAAVITPTPDVINLCIVALPTIALYLLGVGAAWAVQRGKRKRGE